MSKVKSWFEGAMPSLIVSACVGIATVFFALHQSSNETKVEIAKMYGVIAVMQSQLTIMQANQTRSENKQDKTYELLINLVERKNNV